MPTSTLAGSGQALDSSLPTVYREFRLLRDETGVMRSCADAMPLRPHEGTTKYINNYGRLVAYNVDDGADIAQQQTLSDSAIGATPSEIAVQVLLGGRTMRRVADPNLMERTARILNAAYDLKEDTDGCTQLASYTATTLGAAGTVVSPGHIAGGGARVMIGNDRANPEPPMSDTIFAVLHPLSAHVLSLRLTPYVNPNALTTPVGVNTGAHLAVEPGVGVRGGSSDELIRRGYKAIGTVGGVTVKTDANLAVDSSDDATGAIFAKGSLIFVEEESPRIDWDTNDKSMRGAAEGNCWGSYAWMNYRANKHGNPCTFDASLPTS